MYIYIYICVYMYIYIYIYVIVYLKLNLLIDKIDIFSLLLKLVQDIQIFPLLKQI